MIRTRLATWGGLDLPLWVGDNLTAPRHSKNKNQFETLLNKKGGIILFLIIKCNLSKHVADTKTNIRLLLQLVKSFLPYSSLSHHLFFHQSVKSILTITGALCFMKTLFSCTYIFVWISGIHGFKILPIFEFSNMQWSMFVS